MRAGALALRQSALAHLNVQGVLDRGFSILRDPAGRLLTDAAQLRARNDRTATLAHGDAELRVAHTRPQSA